jgi:hypothetical protein
MARISLGSVLAFAVAAWMSAPSQVLAQEKGAQKLMKVQTVEDVQKIEAGDTLVMYCPKCGEAYSQVSEKTFKAAKPEELKTTAMHLCSSCDTKVVTEGVGKQAKEKVVHTCKMCGSENVSCYVIKKKS